MKTIIIYFKDLDVKFEIEYTEERIALLQDALENYCLPDSADQLVSMGDENGNAIMFFVSQVKVIYTP